MPNRARSYSHNVKQKRLKFPAIREYFEILGDRSVLKLQGNTKKFQLYLRKKLPDNARNFKVNEQCKYKSVAILFLFLVIEGKPKICNS